MLREREKTMANRKNIFKWIFITHFMASNKNVFIQSIVANLMYLNTTELALMRNGKWNVQTYFSGFFIFSHPSVDMTWTTTKKKSFLFFLFASKWEWNWQTCYMRWYNISSYGNLYGSKMKFESKWIEKKNHSRIRIYCFHFDVARADIEMRFSSFHFVWQFPHIQTWKSRLLVFISLSL